MKKIQLVLIAVILLAATPTVVQADILDFSEVSSGFQGSLTISLSNATINSFGTDSFVYHPGDSGALGGGGFCGIDGGTCEAGAEVVFASPISDLTFNTQYYGSGDSTLLEIFAGATSLSSIAIEADTAVDFTGFSGVTKLEITDSSTAFGYGYTNFEFTAVPEPSTLVLTTLGLLAIGFCRRRRI